jgi:GTPase
MAAEIIREQILVEMEEEIPYATTVIVDNFEEGARLTRIAATIYCEREGQKGILIGKRGGMLKKIGTSARLRIERMLETKVFLELYVKVQPGWRDARGFVEELDWRRQLEHVTNLPVLNAKVDDWRAARSGASDTQKKRGKKRG